MNQKCNQCGSNRILAVQGKCSDLFNAEYKGKEYDGYVDSPGRIIGGGDYFGFSCCLECGKIQDEFPVPDPEWYEMEEEE